MKKIYSVWIAGLMLAGGLNATNIQFTIKNVGPEGGLWIMRPWIGIHDGNFPTFTVGQAASSGVQHIAEDGVSGDTTNTSLLSGPSNACTGNPAVYNGAAPCEYDIFNAYAGGSQQATIGGPTIPGAMLVKTFSVDPTDPKAQYLSFLVMFIPSNDAFFGTDTAHSIKLFDSKGNFNHGRGPIRLLIQYKDILDAGTEVNTENSTDTAFFGQTVPGTGTHPDTTPVVYPHDSWGPNIVNGHNIFPGSQLNLFNRANYGGPVAEVVISEVN